MAKYCAVFGHESYRAGPVCAACRSEALAAGTEQPVGPTRRRKPTTTQTPRRDAPRELDPRELAAGAREEF